MTNHRLPDGPRFVEFTGAQLATASSDDGKAQRWTELTLYLADTGRYVLHKVGRSVVYHAAGSRCSREAQRVHLDELAARERETHVTFLPCIHCGPPDNVMDVDGGDAHVLLERDRHHVTVSETAAGIVSALHNADGDGALFLTNVARHLLELASDTDPGIAEAYRVQRV